MKGEPNEENCSVSDNEDTGPLSEVTAESAAVEAETMPDSNMEEKKVEPKAIPEVNPADSALAGSESAGSGGISCGRSWNHAGLNYGRKEG